jgi:Glycosyl transferase family 2
VIIADGMDTPARQDLPLISMVTVTFNSAEYIRGCFGSVAEDAATLGVEHIVVDNGSRDGSADIVRREFPAVVLVENGENRGFTAANNQGAEKAGGRYVVFLNPDTIIPRGTLGHDGRHPGVPTRHRRAGAPASGRARPLQPRHGTQGGLLLGSSRPSQDLGNRWLPPAPIQ